MPTWTRASAIDDMLQHLLSEDQARLLQCVGRRLEFVPHSGKEMQLSEILCMLDCACRQVALRIVSLVFQLADTGDRRQEVFRFRDSRRLADLACMADRP